MKLKINLVGQLFGSSGYANHTRGLFNELCKIADVKLDVPLVQGWELECNDEELVAIKKEYHKDAYNVCINMVPQWTDALVEKGRGFIGYCVWEGDKVPLSFKDYFEKASLIIVPSNHVRIAIENTFGDLFKKKTRVVPHGVNMDLFCPSNAKKIESDDVFVFTANKGWSEGNKDRGGVQFLLKAFTEEFSPEEKVILKLKINPAYNNPNWNIREELSKLNLKHTNNLMISSAMLKQEGMPMVYAGDCFVSPTMAEAFSLPCLEALSCGIPVITTGFGGQTDYVNEDNGLLVDYDLWDNDTHWMYEGIKWAKPKIIHLRKLMREAYEEKFKQDIKLRESVIEYTWKNSAQALLNEILSLEAKSLLD